MSTLKKELLRKMINEGNLSTAQDLHSFFKDLFLKMHFKKCLKQN
ncbi:hypothetical protein SAMN02745135_02470 [Caloranaerobacter azorensis DSM 13643]|uniref:Uncharacterized protein n=1 Tax=Caloranaerobacter azorensis DSM 13643 TaxID=1121264 RepID=A0A1M5WH53_9FIRM|nr:hypothetical protein SAMN02745135_02470 [Caloranaerobacter azorensis DSM 13643]